MSSKLRISGAIAQLGERLLCKQEVVGSIPSGSTINWRSPSRGFADGLFPRKFEKGALRVPLVLFSNREEVTQSSSRKGAAASRRSYDGCVHEVSWSFRSVPNCRARHLPSSQAGIDDESNQVP